MIQIRKGVFETNSSSTHSLTICSREEYEKFEKEELFFAEYDDNFLTKKEVQKEFYQYIKDMEEQGVKSIEIDDEVTLFEDFLYERGYSMYCDYGSNYEFIGPIYYTTKNGDKVVAFGYFGHD